MNAPIPAFAFDPETDRSYLVFCPEHGGWHVGEWWTIDGPGRWVLSFDASVDLPPVSHVMDVPADAMATSGLIQWATMRSVTPAGNA
jgi:hypothetical protein